MIRETTTYTDEWVEYLVEVDAIVIMRERVMSDPGHFGGYDFDVAKLRQTHTVQRARMGQIYKTVGEGA